MNSIVNIPLEDATPEIGDLAYNEDGAMGVITDTKLATKSAQGFARSHVVEKIFVGVHISNDHAPKGSPWESKKPVIVGCVNDAKAFVESLKDE